MKSISTSIFTATSQIRLGLLLLVFVTPVSAQEQPQPLEHGLSYAYGTPAPAELVLATLSGKNLRLADLKGRVVLINFWATWCPPCVAELPTLEAFYNDLHGSGVEVLAVNLGESSEEINTFLNNFETPLRFPILKAEKPKDILGWKITAMPTTYIVNKTGNIEYTAIGPRDFQHPKLKSRILALLAR